MLLNMFDQMAIQHKSPNSLFGYEGKGFVKLTYPLPLHRPDTTQEIPAYSTYKCPPHSSTQSKSIMTETVKAHLTCPPTAILVLNTVSSVKPDGLPP